MVKRIVVGLHDVASSEDCERWSRMLENGETDRLRAELDQAAAKAYAT